MNPQPKPKPRAKKAPKRKHTCVTRSCNRVPTAGAMCRTHAKAKADDAWSAAVRNGNCDLAEWHWKLPLRCGSRIQGCHGISRGHMGTRYLLENGFSGCDSVNGWAFRHPADWDRALRFELWGEEKYARMWAIAEAFGKKGESVDYEAVIAELSRAT